MSELFFCFMIPLKCCLKVPTLLWDIYTIIGRIQAHCRNKASGTNRNVFYAGKPKLKISHMSIETLP